MPWILYSMQFRHFEAFQRTILTTVRSSKEELDSTMVEETGRISIRSKLIESISSPQNDHQISRTRFHEHHLSVILDVYASKAWGICLTDISSSLQSVLSTAIYQQLITIPLRHFSTLRLKQSEQLNDSAEERYGTVWSTLVVGREHLRDYGWLAADVPAQLYENARGRRFSPSNQNVVRFKKFIRYIRLALRYSPWFRDRCRRSRVSARHIYAICSSAQRVSIPLWFGL